MQQIKKEIIKLLLEHIKLKKEEIESLIEVPPDPALGDLSFPCFTLSKIYKKNPAEISNEIFSNIIKQKNQFIEKIEVKGPYINFFIKKEKLAQIVIKQIRKQRNNYGRNNTGKKQKVMVEFSQPNTHKGFHIGHLRNTCLGDSLVKILRFSNYNVIAANYPGDIGAHVAKCLWLYLKFYKNKEPKTSKGIWLGQLYANATKLLEQDESYKQEYEELLKKLYNRDKEIIKAWKKTRSWSLDEFKKIYKELNVNFNIWFFESQLEEEGKKYAQELLKEDIAKESDNAIIFDLKQYNLGVLIILRSNQTPLYSTKDLVLAARKFNKYKIEKSVYVVASEQKFYFQQLFKALEIIGFKNAGNCFHLSYELVMLKEGKMSSREGNVILYEDLMERALKKEKEELNKRRVKINNETKAKIIALAALKYSMLNVDSNKTIIFDWDKALSFEGDSGPYLLYTYARISSILRNASINSKIKSTLTQDLEHQIIKKLSEFPEQIVKAAIEYKPNVIANYIYELAQLTNEYYHKFPILKEKAAIKNSRLLLINSIKQVMLNSFNILNIKPLEKM